MTVPSGRNSNWPPEGVRHVPTMVGFGFDRVHDASASAAPHRASRAKALIRPKVSWPLPSCCDDSGIHGEVWLPGMNGTLRNASLIGTIGKCRGAMSKEPAEFAAAEANLLESHTKPLTPDPWEKAEPGQGHAAQAAEWKTKFE